MEPDNKIVTAGERTDAVRQDRLWFLESMDQISRDPLELVRQAMSEHQYPDGFVLMLGTLFAPTQDRDTPGRGFTHKVGDVVKVSTPKLGCLENRVTYSKDAREWTFGIADLMQNLADRGLLKPRARRNVLARPRMTCTTESSIRFAISRSWNSAPSAMSPSLAWTCALSMICGSWQTLPLVMTRGRSISRVSNKCSGVYGSIKPTELRPGAMPSGNFSAPSAESNTIGDSGLSNKFSSAGLTLQYLRIISRSLAISANGLPYLCLRCRRRWTASALVASQAR